jgi:acyl-CoA dehydrogenase
MAPHPLATLRFQGLPGALASAQLGAPNGGFKLAMQTLDIFRASVAGAALGFARRALAEAVAHARQRRMFGQTWPTSSSRRPSWATWPPGRRAALLTYRAAWLRDDVRKARVRTSRERPPWPRWSPPRTPSA